MGATLTPLCELDPAAIGAWRDLAARAAEPNPFFEADPVLLAARHLGRDDVGLLAVHEDGELIAALPVVNVLRWRQIPLPVIASWRHEYCLLGTPLLDRERCGPAAAGLVAALGAGRANAFAGLDWVTLGGPVDAALRTALAGRRPIALETFDRPSLRRRAGTAHEPDPKQRKKSAKHRRRLAAELQGDVEVTDVAGDPAGVEAFLELEASGWKGREGTAMSSVPGHADFLRELGAALAAEDRLELLCMRAGGRTVAMRLQVRAQDGLFFFKSAYDEELSRFGPGVLLIDEALARFATNTDQAFIDSCADLDRGVLGRLLPDRRHLQSLAVPRAGLVGAGARPVLHAAAKAIERKRSKAAA